MPYIKKEGRAGLEPFSDPPSQEWPKNKGELNYVITRLMVGYVQDKGKNYQSLSDAIAAATDAASEFRRRILDPYENEKIEENGDVYDELLGWGRGKGIL